MYIYSYNPASESAKALRKKLNILSIKHENSKFKGKEEKVVINWGASDLPNEVMKCRVFNAPAAVKKSIDKREFFAINKDISVPSTTNKEEAIEWLNKGRSVVIRTVVNGHGGEGVKIVENKEELIDAPLYTQYIPKKEEYRIHVFHGKVFFVQRKARVKETPDAQINWKVRNLAGGFIFANQDVQVPKEANEMAVKCVINLGLDFGAVDIIYNEKRNAWYCLEVNTAPGLAGTTLEKYCEQFGKM